MRDGAGGEGFHFAFATVSVFFFVPAWESSEEKKADECEDDGDDTVVCQSQGLNREVMRIRTSGMGIRSYP